jgi:anaerobic selenocysteine-containing dehydrogenase
MVAANNRELRIVQGACHHDCPDTCAWEATVEDGRVIKLRGSDDHPTTRGQLCPKVNRFVDRVYHADRLLTPLRRTGPKGTAEFEAIGWDEAMAEIAARLGEVVERSGAEAILQYSFDGTQGVIQKGIMADRFFDALGASDIRRHLCGVTAWLGASDVSGLPFGIDPEDMAGAKMAILWGTNTLLTNRHLWPTIKDAEASGATVVVIDPIRTPTAAAPEVDAYLQIKPGTDVALVLAMLHVMDRDGLLDHTWLADSTTDWEGLRESAAAMSPPEAAAITGLDSRTIEWLAHTYATKQPAAIRVLVGPEHREHGRQLMRSIALLPAATGAWQQTGGGLARSTQVYFETALNYPENRPHRRVFNMAALGAVLNDTDLRPTIDALVVHNSNPAVICPDQNAVMDGLARPDLFTVVIEQFVTDTARYADIILPATTQLEHLDLMVAWGHLYLSLNQPAVAPLGQALPNTEIFRRLAVAMELTNSGLADSDEDLVRQLLDSDHQWVAGITFERLKDEGWARLNVPAGHRPYVDLAPETEDGRLRLGRLAYEPGSETVAADPVQGARYPLTLMSRKQHMKFLNANYGGFANHHPRGGKPFLEIHPADASHRGIEEGDAVTVHNDRGELSLAATISADLQPGLVAVPFGWWHRATPQDRSINALTNATVGPDETGSSFFHENLVEVVRAAD